MATTLIWQVLPALLFTQLPLSEADQQDAEVARVHEGVPKNEGLMPKMRVSEL